MPHSAVSLRKHTCWCPSTVHGVYDCSLSLIEHYSYLHQPTTSGPVPSSACDWISTALMPGLNTKTECCHQWSPEQKIQVMSVHFSMHQVQGVRKKLLMIDGMTVEDEESTLNNVFTSETEPLRLYSLHVMHSCCIKTTVIGCSTKQISTKEEKHKKR